MSVSWSRVSGTPGAVDKHGAYGLSSPGFLAHTHPATPRSLPPLGRWPLSVCAGTLYWFPHSSFLASPMLALVFLSSQMYVAFYDMF